MNILIFLYYSLLIMTRKVWNLSALTLLWYFIGLQCKQTNGLAYIYIPYVTFNEYRLLINWRLISFVYLVYFYSLKCTIMYLVTKDINSFMHICSSWAKQKVIGNTRHGILWLQLMQACFKFNIYAGNNWLLTVVYFVADNVSSLLRPFKKHDISVWTWIVPNVWWSNDWMSHLPKSCGKENFALLINNFLFWPRKSHRLTLIYNIYKC